MAPRRWRLTAVLASASIGALAAAAPEASARGTENTSRIVRLRAADDTAASLLRIGIARSATFRQIAAELERSDVVVYVQARPMRLPGQLQFVAARGGLRYVRVSVRTPAVDAVLVAWLGHELYHALEIASAPEVVDEASLIQYYERIGSVYRSAAVIETGRAQLAWRRILDEVRGGRRGTRDGSSRF